MTLVATYSKFLLGTLISLSFFILLYLPLFQQPPLYARSSLADVKGWEANRSRNSSHYVRPLVQTTIMSGSLVCPSSPLTLLIVVCSGLGHRAMREAIRETWGKSLPSNTSVIFFVGRTNNDTSMDKSSSSLKEEQTMFQDIVQEDFIDSYNNLTIATIMMLKFVTHRCSHAKFIVKADDDIYFNVPKLYLLLTTTKFPEYYRLAGKLITEPSVYRSPDAKWYAPRYLYKENTYPNFLTGPGYVMSKDVAITLYNMSLNLPLFHLEDVFITGICAEAARIKRHHIVGVHSFYHYVDICNPSQIVVHYFSPEMLHELWRPIREGTCKTRVNASFAKLVMFALFLLFSILCFAILFRNGCFQTLLTNLRRRIRNIII
uniref:Hexosyltransferase n=1 Tax=Cacopsylla melanoneura TaxID=428564 RepID=A0A8D8U0A0_9HEMI